MSEYSDTACRCQNSGEEELHLLHSSTMVFMEDGTVSELGRLKVGDRIIGVRYDGVIYRYKAAEVTEVSPRICADAYKLTVWDGRELICSPSLFVFTTLSWRRVAVEKYYTGNALVSDDRLKGFGSAQMASYLEGRAGIMKGCGVAMNYPDCKVVDVQHVGMTSDMMWIEVDSGCFMAEGFLVHDHSEFGKRRRR